MLNKTSKNNISSKDLHTLTKAKQQMEDIGWAMKGLNKVGNFIQTRVELLPLKQQKHAVHYGYCAKRRRRPQ